MHHRHPVVAGQFYPDDPTTLRATVEAYAGQERGTLAPHLVMLPHAGYMYCGAIIGETLQKVRLPSTLFLLGPNHTGQGKSMAIWAKGHWRSPLGSIEVDIHLAEALLQSKVGFSADTAAHAREHSLEVLLPFLQVLAPQARIVPIAIASPELLPKAGAALGQLMAELAAKGQESCMIVSSDMNHFADHETTIKLDSLALSQFLRLDPQGLLNTVMHHKISMCGVLPAVLGLYACQVLQSSKATLVRHGTSSQVTGDVRSAVGYAGAYIY